MFFVERKLKIDDPVGAISVHGVSGIFGVLAVGIFANGKLRRRAGTAPRPVETVTEGVTGILYGGTGAGQLAAQAVGVRSRSGP